MSFSFSQVRLSLVRGVCLVLASAVSASCGAPRPEEGPASPNAVYPNETRFGLTFEERMAVAAQISRLKGEANKRADEIYDPFRSRENAIRNEETSARFFSDSRALLMREHRLTDEQLGEILREYQASLGANLR